MYTRRRKQSSPKYSLLAGVLTLLIVALPFIFALLNKQTNRQGEAAGGASIYWGAFVQNSPQDITQLNAFETKAKKGLSIVHWYQSMGEDFPTSFANIVRTHGSIPMISYDTNNTGYTPSPNHLANIYNGSFDTVLAKYAQGAKTWGQPLFIRLDWEMNISTSPYYEGSNSNVSGDYAKMWRHVHDVFIQNGATNVTWVWCPNGEYPGTTALEGLYPGDQYVDWTCFDTYNWGTSQTWSSWTTFSNLVTPTYTHLLQVAPTKPVMLGEISSAEQGGDKAAWITDMFTTLPSSFPKLKAVVWFNGSTIATSPDWRIDSSTAAQNAFAAAIASTTYASNGFSALTGSPIQPLVIPTPSTSSGPTVPPTSSGPTVAPTGSMPTAIPTPTATFLARDTFQRANRTFWGVATDGHTWGADAATKNSFTIANNIGKEANGAANTYTGILGATTLNANVLVTGSLSSFSGTNNNFGSVVRYKDANNWYKAYIDGGNFIIQKKINGASTNIKQIGYVPTSGTMYSIRFQIIGTTLSAKVWPTSQSEPAAWTLTVTDASLTSAGNVGIRVLTSSTAVVLFTAFQATAL